MDIELLTRVRSISKYFVIEHEPDLIFTFLKWESHLLLPLSVIMFLVMQMYFLLAGLIKSQIKDFTVSCDKSFSLICISSICYNVITLNMNY